MIMVITDQGAIVMTTAGTDAMMKAAHAALTMIKTVAGHRQIAHTLRKGRITTGQSPTTAETLATLVVIQNIE